MAEVINEQTLLTTSLSRTLNLKSKQTKASKQLTTQIILPSKISLTRVSVVEMP